MTVLLGLASSACIGTSDFLAGRANRRSEDDTSLTVMTWVRVYGLLGAFVFVALFGRDGYSHQALGLGMVAGVVAAIGVVFLYRGLRLGRMGVVSTVTAVVTAVVPVVVGGVLGERPQGLTWVGIGLALVALAVIALGESGDMTDGEASARDVRRGSGSVAGLTDALLAGVLIGAMFSLLSLTPGNSGAWPILGLRLAAVVAGFILIVIRNQPRSLPAGATPTVAFAGVTDTAGVLCFLLASRKGLLAVAAVSSSLFPVVTVILAAVFLSERLGPIQAVGVAIGLAGVSILAVTG